MKYKAVVKNVLKNSIAEEAGIQSGDIIATINDNIINDELDFRFYAADDFLSLQVIKPNGDEEIIEVEYPDSPDLGIEFESALMGTAKSCSNKCIFCFIDQLPKGMRNSLYFKDDDTRLSFLNGNYITLTNVSDKDIDKIIKMRLDPVNVSVHTTNPELRCFMLKNKKAGDVLKYLNRLKDAGIHMNGQIVLVKGVNDGEELDRTIRDLSKLYPFVTSVSVVPVGITKYRGGLYHLEPFSSEECIEVINQVLKWQKKLLKEIGSRFIYGADEFYIKSNAEIPADEEYEGYYQIENGVGLIRSLIDEFRDAIEESPLRPKKVSIITGKAAFDTIKMLADEAMSKYNMISIEVFPVKNDFFGEHITVSGLVTGGDIAKQLQGKDFGEVALIPEVMLKNDTELFLDDMTVTKISKILNTKIEVVRCTGYDLWSKIKE